MHNPPLEGAAAQRLAAYLNALESGSPDLIRQFIEREYSPGFLSAGGPAHHLHRQELCYFTGRGFAIRSVQESSEHSLTVLAQERLTGHWRRVQLEVEPNPPHAICALQIQPTLAPAPLEPLTPAQVARECGQFLDRLAAADAFSGAVLVAHHGQPIFTGAYGQANQRYSVLNRTETRFGIASVGKMFTGVAIAQLAERGKLRFDRPVGEYLPGYPEPVASGVTVHHLLTHTSGLGCIFTPNYQSVMTDVRTIDSFLPFVGEEPLAFTPGTGFQYSNAGFILLGAIVERLTGQSYYDYVAGEIFDPAGMTESGFFETDEVAPNVAMGYTRLDEAYQFHLGRLRENIYRIGARGSSAGGAYSTVGDLFRFTRALLEHRLLSPAMTELVTRGQVEMAHTNGERYGYGFISGTALGRKVVGHSGGCEGCSAHVEIYPEQGYTAVVLSNYDFAFAVRDHVRGLVLR